MAIDILLITKLGQIWVGIKKKVSTTDFDKQKNMYASKFVFKI